MNFKLLAISRQPLELSPNFISKKSSFPLAAVKRIILFFLLLFVSVLSFSQQVTWGFGIGEVGAEHAERIYKGSNGNIFMVGEYRGVNVDFDPSAAGTTFLSSNGQSDGFVSEYTPGGQLVRAFSIGGALLDKINAISTDPAGNIYITGFFRGTVDFDPSAATANLTSNGDAGSDPGYGGDIFLAKYTPTGQYVWAINIGGTELYDSGMIVQSDATGNVYMAGYFKGAAVDFDPGAGIANLSSTTGGTAFLSKYNTNGQYQWAFNIGGVNLDNTIFDMELDAAGNIYTTGYFQGTAIDFDPGAGTALLSSNGAYEMFLAKYNNAGQYQFAFSAGGTGNDVGRDLTLDNAGNIYVTGDFTGANVDFNPSATTNALTSNGGSDVFVAKYTNTGQYAFAFNAGSGGSELGWRIATDNNNIFITGGFTGTADFNPSAATDNLVSNGSDDIFLAKYDMTGNYQCAFNVGSAGSDQGWGIVIDGNDRFYLAGGFRGVNTDFAPGNNAYTLSSAGADDIFLVKYLWPPNTLPTGTLQGSTICAGQPGKLTYTSTAGTGPFIIKYTVGATTYLQTNVQSGIPFSVQVPPVTTTTYTLTSITDAVRCSPVNTTPASSATITVRTNCAPEQIINDYTEVTSIGEPCNNRITVTSAAAFHVGDTVLIIQMQGADVNATNTPAFGSVTNYHNAGAYEFNYVKAINGNKIDLLNVLTRTYDVPNGKVQLIRVPYYDNLNTVNRLTCLPWDGSKGGVLVFNVAHTLSLGTDIDVTGKGFKGALGHNTAQLVTNCFTNNFFYATPGGLGIAALKGEGIAILPSSIALGKGASANGGGGGLDHNSGGGGGGNGGVGGFGGYQLAACNNAPYASFDNRGFGGINLPYTTVNNRIFLGGGGGAGHANNPANVGFQPSGANGGGIVIISAETIQSNGNSIISNGADAPTCNKAVTNDCHDGEGGGGAGGTVLLSIPTIADNTQVLIRGGEGADVSGDVFSNSNLGPGGGGGGGIFWISGGVIPANITLHSEGGNNGVCLLSNTGAPWVSFPNDPWGSTPGQAGISVTGLQLPIDIVPFKPNIDSVRINKTATSCTSYDFHGLGYTNTSAVSTWQWNFGDGGTASSQDATHNYTTAGSYDVKLVITDINGCKDSIITNVTVSLFDFDFTYAIDACDPLMVHFSALGATQTDTWWDFGDNTTATGTLNPVHMYAATGDYIVRFANGNGFCSDTITKTISLVILKENIVLTRDTTICIGNVKQLLSVPSLDFCWTPITFLDNPNSPNPVTSTPQDITYFLTAQVAGNNIITNGDFSQGNTGFTSQYNFTTTNLTEGQYFVGPNPQTWNGGMFPCHDHTTGTGNMMMLNGSPVLDQNMWKQTVSVVPNTNYAFATWIQSLSIDNPAQLQFSINGRTVGSLISATLPTCTWAPFYTTWNSGNSTSAVISIVNKNTIRAGNDFALDDITFSPVFIKRDSVKITVEKPLVKTSDDITVCKGAPVQLSTTGAQTYTWSPAGGLNDAGIGNPVATPAASTEYHVTGTTANGCIAKDTVNVNLYPVPVITKSKDTTICINTSAQLFVSGGSTYSWTPSATLNNPGSPTPVATPVTNTTYHVTITDINHCDYQDSVKVFFHLPAQFAATGAAAICLQDSVILTASGGNTYSWQPAGGLSNVNSPNPKASPAITTDYTVQITETTCNTSSTLPVHVTVKPVPEVHASSANDIDCSNDQSQLSATGASTYQWTPAASLNNPGIRNPVASPRVNTQYVVTGTDAGGCHDNDTLEVKVLAINEGAYLMPNAFTPNGDGLNDCFGIRYWGAVQTVEFSIYNRWGQRIFYTEDPNGCWDGTYMGVKQPSDVFVYMIRAKTSCAPLVFRKGTFVLIR